MTHVRSWLLVVVSLAACGDDGPPVLPPDGDIEPPIPWWTPEPGEAANWDIQLAAPFDTSVPRQMYLLDLWDVSPGGTITYDDATTVTVPAGALAGAIDAVKSAGAVAICHVDVGAIRLGDPDVAKFPGSAGTLPDDPDAPEAGSVVGWSVIGDADTRYLDVRAASRAMWEAAMFKRFEHAKQIGCEGIDADWMDQNTRGFGTTGGDEIAAYYDAVVADLHARELSAGFHAKTQVGKLLSGQYASTYDFAVTERSGEFNEFDLTRGFAQAGKAEFAYDFEDDGVTDRDGDKVTDGLSFTTGCTRMNLPADWIFKSADGAFRPTSTTLMQRADCP
jgi:predicted small lipoprotein YifL